MDTHRLRAVLITPNRLWAEVFQPRLVEEAGFELLCALEPRPGTQRWSALLAHNPPDCILLDASDQDIALDSLRHFQAMGSPYPIIAFASMLTAPEAIPLMQAGAFEFFDLATPEAQLASIRARLICQLAARPIRQGPPATARIAAFTACTPGAGASTLARHTAAALGRCTGQRVLLMDLNPELVIEPDPREHWNGITIDPQPSAPLSPTMARNRILEAANEFDWVILDLPCAASQLTLALAPELPNIVLAATPDLTALHMAQRSLKLLTQAGVPSANIRLALNRVESCGPGAAKRAELALKHKVEWKIPGDCRRLQLSSESGLSGDGPLPQAMRAIAAGLVNGLQAPPETAQFFWMSRCEEVLA
ncbi:MAG: hypothetical protein IPP47_15790 [Bryobacterales bacterium]|nr:hypothetical protein [Bryobacterales bacterium]